LENSLLSGALEKVQPLDNSPLAYVNFPFLRCPLIAHLARQLGIAAPSCLARYRGRAETHHACRGDSAPTWLPRFSSAAGTLSSCPVALHPSLGRCRATDRAVRHGHRTAGQTKDSVAGCDNAYTLGRERPGSGGGSAMANLALADHPSQAAYLALGSAVKVTPGSSELPLGQHRCKLIAFTAANCQIRCTGRCSRPNGRGPQAAAYRLKEIRYCLRNDPCGCQRS
jgi:hypothetical protein